jgi:hypothetical protein
MNFTCLGRKKGGSQDTTIGISPFLSKCFDFAFLGSGILVVQVGLGC